MNAHTKIEAAAEPDQRALERAAFIRLALTQKRLSWVAHRWADADALRGDSAAYKASRAEAHRLRTAAKWHLDMARRRDPK